MQNIRRPLQGGACKENGTMTANTLTTMIGGLRIALQSLADKHGVTLVVGGAEASTDGHTITLPDLPADDATAALLARGYIDHETAHIRFTDFTVPVRPWLNLIEDVRVEAAQGRAYPGCAVNLRQLVAHLKGQGRFRGQPSNPLSLLMAWASCQGRTTVLGQPLGEVAQQMEQASRTLFAASFCDAFAKLVAQIGHCDSTHDCEALATRIETLIQAQATKTPRVSQQQRRVQDSSSADSAACEDSEAPPDQAAAELGLGEDTAGGAAATTRQLQALQQATVADATAAASELELGALLQQALGDEHQGAVKDGALELIPSTYHHAGYGDNDANQRRVEQCLGFDQARRQTAQLRARLAGLLQALRWRRSSPKLLGHRLDREAVHRLACATPDARCFASRRQKQAENTAVLILGDRSGSMDGERLSLATQAAFVTAEALELLPGVCCAVGFFPWEEQVAQLKSFGEKPKASRFDLHAGGSTPMAEALLWAGMQLTSRAEPRKILVFMTDGRPDNELSARAALQRLGSCGIETYGIGILDRSLLQWMPDGARSIAKVEELPAALVGLLKDALISWRRAG